MSGKISSMVKSATSFQAKKQVASGGALKTLSQDVVEISSKSKSKLTDRIELTDLEKKFDSLLQELHLLEANIKTQKQNLSSFYSANDKFDYQELLAQKRKVIVKLNRLAKKENVNYILVSCDIKTKRIYNRYAPKVLRATTLAELQDVEKLITSKYFYPEVHNMLVKLIFERAKELNIANSVI